MREAFRQMPDNRDEREKAPPSVQVDEEFVSVELPTALRAIFTRAATDPALARKLVFDYFAYAGPDANKQRHHGDILKALALAFKAINTNSRGDPEAARRIPDQLKRIT